MIIWIILFFVIIGVSFILAFRSMQEYHEMPVHSGIPYSLYLIKNEQGLNEEFLKSIDQIIDQKRLIISFERLFKGKKKALVVYGPTEILKHFTAHLDLLELEDYSLKYSDHLPPGILSWEISSHDFLKTDKPRTIMDLSNLAGRLEDSEEIWWQLVLQPKCEKNAFAPLFKALIRVVIIASDNKRAQEIKSKFDEKVKNTNLIVAPQSYSSSQTIKFYQKRSLPQRIIKKENGHFILDQEGIKDLLI